MKKNEEKSPKQLVLSKNFKLKIKEKLLLRGSIYQERKIFFPALFTRHTTELGEL